jgi:hypothetical protein
MQSLKMGASVVFEMSEGALRGILPVWMGSGKRLEGGCSGGRAEHPSRRSKEFLAGIREILLLLLLDLLTCVPACFIERSFNVEILLSLGTVYKG